MNRITNLIGCVVALMLVVGCSTEPKGEEKKEALSTEVQSTLARMRVTDPGIDDILKKAYGYTVFPSVGKGGLIVGGSYGRGEVYEGGSMVGFSDISQATVGLQAGGQTFSEVVVFETKAAMDNFKYGKLKFAANASAVALKSGASASAKYTDGVLVITQPIGGLMFEASIGGQSFTFQPK